MEMCACNKVLDIEKNQLEYVSESYICQILL